MRGRSRSTLFLMEQLIVILVFAVCAAVCVSIFADSYLMQVDSVDIKNALSAAESGAECFKAYSGDLEKASVILEGSVTATGALEVFYDGQWRPCEESVAEFYMLLTGSDGESPLLLLGELTILRISGEELASLSLAVRRDES